MYIYSSYFHTYIHTYLNRKAVDNSKQPFLIHTYIHTYITYIQAGSRVLTLYGTAVIVGFRAEDNMYVARLPYGIAYLNPNIIFGAEQLSSQALHVRRYVCMYVCDLNYAYQLIS